MDLKNYVTNQVFKLHKKTILENQKDEILRKLNILKEDDQSAATEQKTYESNAYESYKQDLEEVVKSLAEACNKLESAALRQDQHIKTLPEVAGRMDEGQSHKQVILDIFKEVKRAKITAERKMYEIR